MTSDESSGSVVRFLEFRAHTPAQKPLTKHTTMRTAPHMRVHTTIRCGKKHQSKTSVVRAEYEHKKKSTALMDTSMYL